MKLKLIIGYILIISTQNLFAQRKTIKLEDMWVSDTVYNRKIISEIKRKDFIKGTNMFFSKEHGSNWGVFLFENEKNYWLVYSLDDHLSNGGIGKNVYINKNYVKLYSYRYKGFYNEKETEYTDEEYSYSFYFLINYKNKKYTSFMAKERIYEYRGKVNSGESKLSWSSNAHLNIWFKNNCLIIKNNSKTNDLTKSCTYKIVH